MTNRGVKIGVLLLLSLQLLMLTNGTVSALSLDGRIDESEWTHWFTDTGIPSYSAYTYQDESSIYIGIITESTIPDTTQLELAFKGSEYDYILLNSDTDGTMYRRSKVHPGLNADYWRAPAAGLPEGVNLVKGITGTYYSYEISISKTLLGEYSEDFPSKFKPWIMYTVDGNGGWVWSISDVDGEANFYPDMRIEWWFSYEPIERDGDIIENSEIPVFHAPEIPLGSVLSLATMMAAMLIISRNNRVRI